MNFHSAEFVVLLAAVFLLNYALPLRARNAMLLAASAVFYMWWRPEYILLILFSAGIDYAVALRLGPDAPPRRRRLLLAISLVSNLGLLFFFKYFGLAVDSLRALAGWAGRPFDAPGLEVVLPVGISFYTFQALSYTIDVYRGEIPPERRFSRLCLYVLFFPQLVAGPIERSGRLLPQFDEPKTFDAGQAAAGLRRVLWGLVKKVVVADRLALIADPVYADPAAHSGAVLLLATYAFAFQIYADFSAYSDIAVGSARMLGFRLMRNFDRPYFATSPADFWRRWHVSLSTWFRDYVYVPLGGNRRGPARWAAALLVTFLLSGLWHGARWTFVAWGAYHGLLLLLARAAARLPAPPAWFRALLTFHLVLLGWVFFRASTFGDVALILGRIAALGPAPGPSGVASGDVVVAALGVVLLLAADGWTSAWKAPWPTPLRWAAYAAGALLVLNGRLPAENPFIYFRF
jgi:alginate O-acetyltransferase complex protein AlgI